MIDVVVHHTSPEEMRPAGTRASGASWATSPRARATMLANRSQDTNPELAIRRILHSAGKRYRTNFAPLPDRPRLTADIVFTRKHVAVFIDGCFWHRCPEHFVAPKSNTNYWGPKIAANVARDIEVSRALTERGWRVLRFWEHVDPAAAAAEIISAIGGPSGNASTMS